MPVVRTSDNRPPANNPIRVLPVLNEMTLEQEDMRVYPLVLGIALGITNLYQSPVVTQLEARKGRSHVEYFTLLRDYTKY